MDEVKVTQERVVIPTYEAGEPCRHPMFLEKRVYQGSSGKVYPHPVTESVSDEKVDKEYIAIFLENKYLKIMILPELGGRIQRMYDKTNGYDAVYYNEVIKPALVGLAGPWISGGIEFNWPQHHRPSTFDCVDYDIRHNDDGSVTVWCGEIENMYHTKGMAGFTLYPDKAYLEIKGKLYNPTEIPQTFLWWANPAVAVNENTQSIFPPDVHAVMDHGKRGVSKFPIATGTYYNMDYSEGVDISRYKNIPVPTSYMAYHSDYDFVGNYDYGVNAGLMHIADHHVSPGKKQWTWGCGDFGKAWDRNLTDENGPYIELMTGVFTDNQPDFTFLMPYEEKTFKQYFMPYKDIGAVKNASLEVMANLEVEDEKAHIMLYAPAQIKVRVLLSGAKATSPYIKETVALDPENGFDKWIELENEDEATDLTLVIKKKNDDILLKYTPEGEFHGKTPEPAKAARAPKDIASLEELYLTAVHLEQYRHATRRPEEYYLEGLRRDPLDIRLNNGYGKILYKKGLFDEAEKHFRNAIKRATYLNPNPYDCEPYYNLGLALKMQKRYEEAYDAFYKATWDGKMQDKGFYQLACVSAKLDNFKKALEFVDKSLARGSHNMRARTLRSALLRHEERIEEAIDFTAHSIAIDPLDFGARYEMFLLSKNYDKLYDLTRLMRGSLQNYLELSICYAEANLLGDAANVLALIAEDDKPMLHYYMAYCSESSVELERAAKCRKTYAFPNRLQDIMVLNYAIENSPEDAFARYALGNLYYDKGVWFKAIKLWKAALEIEPKNSAILRNLSIATYNKLNDPEEALKLMEKAFRNAPDDSRIYYELDLLRKLSNWPVKKRLKDMIDHIELVESRDDLFTEYITLMNCEKYYEFALRAIKRHKFHPWEGGEGKISYQYKYAHMGIARELVLDGDYEDAIAHLEEALRYPENLGEGKLINSMDNDVYYMLGFAYENVDKIDSIEYYKKATKGEFNLSSMRYYNDTPPDMYFFRTMAYGRLGDEKKLIGGCNTLINYAEEHIDDKPEIDYFAVSLPDFLVFEGNLERDNYVHCCFLAALGYYGKGMEDKCAEFIHKGLERNCSHEGLLTLENIKKRAPKLKEDDVSAPTWAKWGASNKK
ncbi:MAG: DUF5107 domain-containing protein [Candidatus Ornithomonoglobus sp.]